MLLKVYSTVLALVVLSSCGRPDAQFSNLAGSNPRQSGEAFPTMPHDRLTPGSLCQHPTEQRYPEHIDYCERDVSTSTKQMIIRTYDNELGYSIGEMNRQDFKIDHLIPLCAGGSNNTDNLWPQHKTVYVLTDNIEAKICQLMQLGQMQQERAVEIILNVKHHLDTAHAVEDDLTQRIQTARR